MNYSESMKAKFRLNRFKAYVRPVLKYLALTLLGFMLFMMAAKQARIDRGYSAIGGEVFFLFLPVFYYLISKTVRDWLDDLKKKP